MESGLAIPSPSDANVSRIPEEITTPDWCCSFCSHLNEPSIPSCSQCDKTRLESDAHFFQTFESTAATPNSSAIPEAPTGPLPLPSAELWNRLRSLGEPRIFHNQKNLLIVLATTAVFALFVYWRVVADTVVYRVSSVRWERTVPILRYQWVEREDWANELRGEGIQRISEMKAIHHYEKRLVATGAMRNGTRLPIYRDVPVTALKIRYRAKLYAPVQMARASGYDTVPTWPSVKLGVGLDGKPDREETRKENYTVQLERVDSESSAPKTITLAPAGKRFTSFHIGDSIRFRFDETGAPRPPHADAPISDTK